MLKGTTRIELTDIKTGKKEVIEKHNMLTNAVSNLIQPLAGTFIPNEGMTLPDNMVSNAVSGLLLFNTTITENANTIFAPSGITVTGCAQRGRVNTGTLLALGSYNATESEYSANDRRMKFVYDFTTSQGNGVIASVCLTNYDGYLVYGPSFTGGSSEICETKAVKNFNGTVSRDSNLTTGTNYTYLIDPTTDMRYAFSIDDATTITMRKYRAGFTKYSLIVGWDQSLTDTTQLSVLSTSLGANRYYNYNPTDNCLYIVSSANNTIAVDGSIVVTKINVSTYATTQSTLTNNTPIILDLSKSLVHGEYLVVKQYNDYAVYKIKLSDNTSTSVGSVQSSSEIPYIGIDNRVYFSYYYSYSSSAYYTDVVDLSLNTIYKLGTYYLSSYSSGSSRAEHDILIPIKSNGLMWACYRDGTIKYMPNYLATINNLQSPVTKTADKTMKVTYILEEVSSV